MNRFGRTVALLGALCSAAAWSVEIEHISVARIGKTLPPEAISLTNAQEDAVVGAILAENTIETPTSPGGPGVANQREDAGGDG